MPSILRLSARRMFTAVAACAIPTVFAADALPVATAEPVTVIKAGKLIDVATGQLRNDQVIVVQGGKISAVGAAAVTVVPPGATVIDLSSKTVLPGLIDTHTHVTGDPAHAALPRLRHFHSARGADGCALWPRNAAVRRDDHPQRRRQWILGHRAARCHQRG